MHQRLGQSRNGLVQQLRQQLFVGAVLLRGAAAQPALARNAQLLQGFMRENPRLRILVVEEAFQDWTLIAQRL